MMFKNLINGIQYGLGIKKVEARKFYRTDKLKLESKIEEGSIFIFVTADRHINVWKKWYFDFSDFIRGGIQGATQSFWQHSGIGRKIDGKLLIIESLTKITVGELNKYYGDETQMMICVPGLSVKKSASLWNLALTQDGKEYDYLEFVRHLSLIFKWLPNSKTKFVCSSFVAWVFKGSLTLVKESKIHTALPKDIYRGCYKIVGKAVYILSNYWK